MPIYRSLSFPILSLFVLLLALSPAEAQVVETGYGRVEFIGLRSWNAARLIDSLEVLDALRRLETSRELLPGELRSHDSPNVWLYDLEHRFAFPAVVVGAYSDSTAGIHQIYWVITVIEPTDSAKLWKIARPVTWNPAPSDPEWAGLDTMYERHRGQWELAVRTFGYIASGKVEEGRKVVGAIMEAPINRIQIRGHNVEPIPSEPEIEQLWLRIAAITRPYQKKYALQVLTARASDANLYNRIVATAVLANFSHDDGVWNALMSVQLDPWEEVSESALTSLAGLATHLARRIDWTASSEMISAILDGNRLEHFTEILDILSATSISPVLAPFILPGHEELLLAYLAAHHEPERASAHRFLVTIAGRDLGNDPALWRKWIAGLKGPGGR